LAHFSEKERGEHRRRRRKREEKRVLNSFIAFFIRKKNSFLFTNNKIQLNLQDNHKKGKKGSEHENHGYDGWHYDGRSVVKQEANQHFGDD
jgi:hypothetical protein